MTTKYRDLSFLVGFGVQLLMYGSAVMYPLSLIQAKVERGSIPNWVGKFIEYNPMTIMVEQFRYFMLSAGSFKISNRNLTWPLPAARVGQIYWPLPQRLMRKLVFNSRKPLLIVPLFFLWD